MSRHKFADEQLEHLQLLHLREPIVQPELNNDYADFDVTPAPKPSRARRAARGCLTLLWEVVQTLVLAALIYFAVNALTVRVQVQGYSMRPTFRSGEFVLVYRLAYRFGEPHRGDIVIFHPSTFANAPRHSADEDYIKRIIGLPGEHVEIRGGAVYIDGKRLNEPYILEPPRYHGAWNVPTGKVFVLGDNRNNSTDSHILGPVAMDSIVGKAVLVYWPMDAWRILRPPAYEVAGSGNLK